MIGINPVDGSGAAPRSSGIAGQTATSLSIAMATYNGGEYLSQQLHSFSAQSLLPNELVVCDDGSNDHTLSVLEAFASSAPFEVKIVRNTERLGYNRNFAKAISLCSGEIIFVSDQDDVWYEHKLRTVLSLFEQHPSILAITNDQTIATASGALTDTTVLQNVRRLGYPDILYGPGCCTAFRRSLLEIAAPLPGDEVPYDHWINIIPALLSARIICEEALQLYRRHESNTSGSVFAKESASSWTLVTAGRRRDVREAYWRQVKMNEAISARLAERQEDIRRLGFGESYEAAQFELKQDSMAYGSRIECLSRSRLRRLPLILRLLRAGTYRRFNGYKSALKDLAGPSPS